MRFRNKDGRVDRSAAGERVRRNERYSEGEDVWVDCEPYIRPPVRRSSRAIDPNRVQDGFLLVLIYLLKSGDYTIGEMAAILNISRATVYRHIDELRKIRQYDAVIRKLEEKGIYIEFDDEFDDEMDEV
jgi:biotin operon repressor